MSDPSGPAGPEDPDPTPDDTSDPTSDPTRDNPEVGSVSEEAAKLLGAFSEWARESGGADGGSAGGVGSGFGGVAAGLGALAEQAATTFGDINEHIATGSAECTYCPVCRTVHVIRETSPEVKTHLATAASSFLQAMAGLLASAAPPASGGRGGALERIDLEDDEDLP